MYREHKLLIPSLHKCHFCKKRLQNPVVAKISYEDICYYCDPECAKQEYEILSQEREKANELNDYIKGLL